MSKLNIPPPSFPSFLFLLFLLKPTFTSALITRQIGDVDEEKQGQTVVPADSDGTKSHASPPPGPNPPRTGPKPIFPGQDDSLVIASTVVGISIIVAILMFAYVWHRRRRLRRARELPQTPDKAVFVDRRGSLASVDRQEPPSPSPQGKLEGVGAEVSFASVVTIVDQIPKPQPVFHAM